MTLGFFSTQAGTIKPTNIPIPIMDKFLLDARSITCQKVHCTEQLVELQCKFVLDVGSLSKWGLITALGQEADVNGLGIPTFDK